VKPRTYQTHSEEETVALGERLAAELPSPCLVLLIGNLGAGKTTLAKGIVKGLGAAEPEDVTSPTFTLIHEYGQRLYHIDLYRIERPQELAGLGLEDLLARDAVILMEWGERFPEILANPHIEIRLQPAGEESRNIEVDGLPD